MERDSPIRKGGFMAHEMLMAVTVQVRFWSIGTINSCHLMAVSS